MFRCQATNKVVPAGTPANRLVTHIRNKTYYRLNKYGDEVACGQGTEIVREILVSKEYADEMKAKGFTPAVVQSKT
jgi:hypothetical protein